MLRSYKGKNEAILLIQNKSIYKLLILVGIVVFFAACDKDFNEIGKILVASESASKLYSHYSGKQKADFLRQIAVEIEHLGDNLIETAANESHLPLARLIGERARTTGQLRLFAEFLDQIERQLDQ